MLYFIKWFPQIFGILKILFFLAGRKQFFRHASQFEKMCFLSTEKEKLFRPREQIKNAPDCSNLPAISATLFFAPLVKNVLYILYFRDVFIKLNIWATHSALWYRGSTNSAGIIISQSLVSWECQLSFWVELLKTGCLVIVVSKLLINT